MEHLIYDCQTETICPYCDKLGGQVAYGSSYLHQECYEELGAELEILYGHRPTLECA